MKKNISNICKTVIGPLIIPILILLIWEYMGAHNMLKETLLPRPSKIITALVLLIQKGTLQKNILVSLKRVLSGYVVGAAAGVLIGISVGLFPVFRRALTFLIGFLRPIPMIAWIPVFILWFGIGEKTKVILISVATFWPVLINVVDGIRFVDQKYLEVSTIFCKSKTDTILHVIVPAALPSIFTGLRFASGSALTAVVAAEMFAASSGLGYMVSNARDLAQADKMLGGVFVIGILGWILNKMVSSMHIKKGRA